VWLLALPSAVGLIVLARPVVELLFQGGKFLPANTAATVPIVQAYMLGVLPYSLVKVLFAGLSSPWTGPAFPCWPRWWSGDGQSSVFNGLTYRRLGATGLALGTTIGALANLAVLRLWFGRVVGPRAATRHAGMKCPAGFCATLCWRSWWQGPGGRVPGCSPRPASRGPGAPPSGPRPLLFATIGRGFRQLRSWLEALAPAGRGRDVELPRRIGGSVAGNSGSYVARSWIPAFVVRNVHRRGCPSA